MADTREPSPQFKIGIMQGRLSPPDGEIAQYFPRERWQEEFSLSRECGFDTIEWLYDAGTEDDNPILDAKGMLQIRDLCKASGIEIASVCADYFKDRSLATDDEQERRRVSARLVRLIDVASRVGVKNIVVPFLEGSTLPSEKLRHTAASALGEGLAQASQSEVNVVLETDLSAEILLGWLEQIDHPSLGVNYDLGNAVAMGYDPIQEISLLGTRIRSVHIKDRTLNGPNVPLGTGAVNFRSALLELWSIGYRGNLVLETVRGQDYTSDAKRNLAYIRDVVHSLRLNG